MEKVMVVTGCAGFIGSHLCERLVRLGYKVIGIDNFDPAYDEAIKRKNLDEVRATAAASQASCTSHTCRTSHTDTESTHAGSFTFYQCDLRTDPLPPEAFPWDATLIHLAASAGVRPSVNAAAAYVENNVLVTTRLLKLAVEQGLRGVVLASSSSVYGASSGASSGGGSCTQGFKETDDTSHPMSPYAATKKACELMAHAISETRGLPVVCLRLFSAYGPRQRPDLAVAKFMRCIHEDKPITVFGNGTMKRDFTYVGDIVEGIVAAARVGIEYGFRVYNLGSDAPTEVMTLVRKLQHVMGRTRVTLEFQDVPPGDVPLTHADIRQARAELGYAPKTDLDEGLAAQWAWFAQQVLPGTGA